VVITKPITDLIHLHNNYGQGANYQYTNKHIIVLFARDFSVLLVAFYRHRNVTSHPFMFPIKYAIC